MNNEREFALRNQFIEGLFVNEHVKYSSMKNGKIVETKTCVTNTSLNAYFSQLFKKYERKYSYRKNDFLADVALIVTEAVYKFEIIDDGSWEYIIDGTDTKNIGRLITFIKKEVRYALNNLYDGIKSTKKVIDENGKSHQMHTFIGVNFVSIDSLLCSNTEERHEVLDVEGSYWDANFKSSAQKAVFSEWFNEMRGKILTKSQNDLITVLESINYFDRKTELSREELGQALGCNPDTIPVKISRIRKKVAKKWNEQRKFYSEPRIIKTLRKELNLLLTIQDFDDDNDKFSKAVRSNIDAGVILRIVQDKLLPEDSMTVSDCVKNKTEIPSRILYVISAGIEEAIEELELYIIRETEIWREAGGSEKVLENTNYFKMPEHGKTIYMMLDANGAVVPRQ